MIVSSFICRFGGIVALLSPDQRAKWEILAICMTALFVLVCITRRQRSKKAGRIYTDQFPERSPLVGVNLGRCNKSRHAAGDLKKDRLAFVHKHQEQDSRKTKELSEQLHEEIRQLRREVFKHEQVEASLGRQIARLAADDEKLRSALSESTPAGEQTIATLRAEKLIKPEESWDEQVEQAEQAEQVEQVEQVQQIEQTPEQRVGAVREPPVLRESVKGRPTADSAGEPAVARPAKEKSARASKTYEQQHRIVDGVRQKLCRTCNEWKSESEYHKNSSSKDGLAGACKTCKNDAARERRQRSKAAAGSFTATSSA
jgi:hypothetical protein